MTLPLEGNSCRKKFILLLLKVLLVKSRFKQLCAFTAVHISDIAIKSVVGYSFHHRVN
jgi:hypothetical protein